MARIVTVLTLISDYIRKHLMSYKIKKSTLFIMKWKFNYNIVTFRERTIYKSVCKIVYLAECIILIVVDVYLLNAADKTDFIVHPKPD